MSIIEIDGASKSKGDFHDKNGNITEYVNFVYRSDNQFDVAQKLASYIQSIRNLLFESHTDGEPTIYTGSFRIATYPKINLKGLIL